MNSLKRHQFVSLVTLISQFNPRDFKPILQKCADYLQHRFEDYEIIIIGDIIYKDYEIRSVLTSIPSIRYIEIPYVMPNEVSLSLGLDCAIGDFVFIFNPSQDSLDLIDKSIDLCDDDCDIIIGKSIINNRSFTYNLLRPIANIVLKEIGYVLPINATSFHCLTRSAVNLVTCSKIYSHQLYLKIARCGLEKRAISYNPNNITNKSLFRGIEELMELLVFNTTKPLRWMSFIGMSGSVISLCFAIYSFIVKLVSVDVADGWSSTVILISFFSMITFMILSLFGEYMNRILNENNEKSLLWGVKERTSSVMLNEKRFNVLADINENNKQK